MLDGTGLLGIVEPEGIHFHRRSGICAVFSFLVGVAGHCICPAPVIFQHQIYPVGIEREDVLNHLGPICSLVGQDDLLEAYPPHSFIVVRHIGLCGGAAVRMSTGYGLADNVVLDIFDVLFWRFRFIPALGTYPHKFESGALTMS